MSLHFTPSPQHSECPIRSQSKTSHRQVVPQNIPQHGRYRSVRSPIFHGPWRIAPFVRCRVDYSEDKLTIACDSSQSKDESAYQAEWGNAPLGNCRLFNEHYISQLLCLRWSSELQNHFLSNSDIKQLQLSFAGKNFHISIMATIAVAGGLGQVGRALVEGLVQHGHKVLVLSRKVMMMIFKYMLLLVDLAIGRRKLRGLHYRYRRL